MKYKGSTMEYSRERLRDLMETYDRYMEECRHISMPDVYENVVRMPARRFWVSEIRAALVVSAIYRGEAHLERMQPLKAEMYMEIHRRVGLLLEAHPDMSISDASFEVVNQPAPRFYITPGSAKLMICKARRQWLEEKWKRLRLFQ